MKKKVLLLAILGLTSFVILIARLGFLMVIKSDYYLKKADALHERERSIKAKRGVIYDRNGIEIAGNKPVCSISVIHSQIKEEEKVVQALSTILGLDEKIVRKKVNANSIREKIKSNVDKEVANQIRELKLDGVMIDEDYKRYYPYQMLASKVLGFTGADNQGIVGLEVQYEKILAGKSGSILTLTDAYGYEIKNEAENRIEPISGNDLYITIDVNMQKYAEQAAVKVLKSKRAKRVSVILMNPQNGEIYAMVNVPEYNLNAPYQLVFAEDLYENLEKQTQEKKGEDVYNFEKQKDKREDFTQKEKQDALNKMWRNFCINDTYEPGSTFKLVTAVAALEENVVKLDDMFSCPGFRIVEDRRIRCHKKGGHGGETFKQGFMNSCNPVFMDVGARVGVENMYKNYKKLGLFEKTGVDLPGEASSIMHNPKNVKAVELATMSFGQSFQITPLQLLRAASATVNGGKLVTPHFALFTKDSRTQKKEEFIFPKQLGVIRSENSEQMKELLEAVVAEGSGNKGSVAGYRVGGKTATSEKLPRRSGKYISSFLSFAPVNNPQIMGLILIDEPKGIYYGGTIAAPVMSEIFMNVLPYLGIEENYENNSGK